MSTLTTQPWVRRMVSRDETATHRASTNLELLFDLTFVVAVAAVARELAGSVAEGHYSHGIVGYLTVFFAIWWAWMNFTWFASAFDTDDVPYRLLTLVQMTGVLVLAAGVANAFEQRDFTAVTIGYVIMRVAMICQWLRAAAADGPHRVTCRRYAVGIAVVQIGWLLRLALPDHLALTAFIVLALAEMAVPLFAERTGMTTWHPDHIAERYGLFTIIVLGECLTQAANALQASYSESGVSVSLVLTGLAGLILLFGLWWLYFVVPQGERLRGRPELSFAWGYGHLIVFSSLAAVAAGLEVALESLTHHVEISHTAVAMSVALPVAIFLVVYGLVCRLLDRITEPSLPVMGLAAVATVLIGFTAAWWPIQVVALLLAVPIASLIAFAVLAAHRRELSTR